MELKMGPSLHADDATQADGPFGREVADGMQIEWDVPFTMADGTIIRVDIFRPLSPVPAATIVSTSIYGKGLPFQDGFPAVWQTLVRDHPEAVAGSSNKYQNWEVVDPEHWVPYGFAVARIDARGSGTSAGYLNPFHDQEARDAAEIIQRIAQQPWSNGNVGMTGISYHAVMGWRTAAMRPPALKAVALWEGCFDHYRDACYHGGIRNEMPERWFAGQVRRVQHGKSGLTSSLTGRPVTGPDALEEDQLAANRYPFVEEVRRQPLMSEMFTERSARVEDIECAVLSAGNWGGLGLHLRGNVEGFSRAGSAEKYLEMHGDEHWTHFCTPSGEAILRNFFGHYLQGKDTGWSRQPKVLLNVRHPDGRFEQRNEAEWPLARTEWTRFYLDPHAMALVREPVKATAELNYDPLKSRGLSFATPPLDEPMELTGPAAARLFVSSASTDADIFLVLKLIDPDGNEVRFNGSVDPNTPLSQGWLRASHRKLDEDKSLPYRPWHTHDELQPLVPGAMVDLHVEIWPFCIVIPAGYRMVLNLRGKDYDCTEDEEVALTDYAGTVLTGMRGSGPFTHADPTDRPAEIFGAPVSLLFDEDRQPFVLLPVIPARAS